MKEKTVEGLPGVYYSKASGNVYQVVDKKAEKQLKVSEDKAPTTGEIVNWGTANDYPQQVLKAIRKNTIIGPTLKRQAEFAYDEIVYGTEDESGNFKRVKDPKVEDFFFRSHIHRYAIQSLRSSYYWYFSVPEIILSKDRSEVAILKCNRTAHFRFGKQNNQGKIDYGSQIVTGKHQ